MDISQNFKKINSSDNSLEKISDFDESHQILKDLEKRLAEVRYSDENITSENMNENNSDEVYMPTFLERIQPFIIPICATLFALIFSGLFLYFFSKSKIEKSIPAITNNGIVEIVADPTPPPVVKQEPIIIEVATPTPPEPEPEPEPVPVKPSFANGTTTTVNVRFEYNKYTYDTHPRGIYVTGEQIFDSEYEDYKILADNRAFANDFLFGVDRRTVSLIGECSYKIDNAKILIQNMRDATDDKKYEAIGDKYFRGKVLKVVESDKPYVSCGETKKKVSKVEMKKEKISTSTDENLEN